MSFVVSPGPINEPKAGLGLSAEGVLAELAARRQAGEMVGLGLGIFVEKSGQGPFDDARFTVTAQEGKLFVVLDPAFRTKKAPDLKIFLSPKPLAQLNNRNATQDSLRVGPLQKSRGAQRLEIPSGTSLDEYKTVLIHCEKFSKLWGGAALR